MGRDADTFGALLRSYRRSAGISQYELAEKSGVSVRTISNLECDRVRWPHLSSARRLADALGLSDDHRQQFLIGAGRRLATLDSGTAATATDRDGEIDGGQTVPRQLPAPVRDFVGRAAELARLDELAERTEAETPDALVIAAIAGTAGVGKTALAVHWAHQVAADFPDGQLYADLRGYDLGRPVPVAQALAAFLRALGMPGLQIPASVSERANAYRSLMSGKRMLIVLDNARSAEQVRLLLPGTSASVVIVTSRNALTGLVVRDGAHRLDLSPLPPSDATHLLRALIGDRAHDDPDTVTRLAALCCRLPLALRLAAELAAGHPDLGLAPLTDDLAIAGRQLDLLDAGGDERTAMRTVLSWSYRYLSGVQADLFCLLSLNPGHDFDVGAASSLADVTPDAASRQARDLAAASLIQSAGPGRYLMHDLLRTYAREQADAQYDQAARRAALTRLFDHYVRTSAIAIQALYPGRFGKPSSDPIEPDAARAWFDHEIGNLPAIVEYMAEHGWPAHATRLADVIHPYLEDFGRTPEAFTILNGALRAAQSTGEREAEGALLSYLGHTYLQQGRYQQAMAHLRRALTAYRNGHDPAGEALALGNLGVVHRRQGRYRQAAALQRQALARYREADDTWGQALTLTRLGLVEQQLGHLPEAADCVRQAVHLYEEIGDPIGTGEALSRLGLIDSHQGRHEEALDHHRQALDLFRKIGHLIGEAEASNCLGETMLAMASPQDARTCFSDALTLSRSTGDQNDQARALHGLARACVALGQADLGRDHLRAAVAMYTAIGAGEAEIVRAELDAL